MPTSKQNTAPHVAAAPDAFWFMRWLAEMEAPLFDTGGSAVEGEERNLLGLAQMATQPWTLFGAQLAMANLVLTQLGAAQVDWTQAWCKAWGGAASPAAGDGGDRRAASMLDPFGLLAQAQAFAGRCIDEWTALSHAGPTRIS